ncbi:MAG: hypothetical protein EOS75_30045 [Mesorhizobium sp.]|nr:MAG: hypothetical protein EOS74_10760 [Mesorhizobium sp.]RWD52219.1 MAG: hypothetical protein EOS75_30045 [Mesorhizobium sp.]
MPQTTDRQIGYAPVSTNEQAIERNRTNCVRSAAQSLSRSMTPALHTHALLAVIEELRTKGVHFRSLRDQIDITTQMARSSH